MPAESEKVVNTAVGVDKDLHYALRFEAFCRGINIKELATVILSEGLRKLKNGEKIEGIPEKIEFKF